MIAQNLPMTMEKKHYLFRLSNGRPSSGVNEVKQVLVLPEKRPFCEGLSLGTLMEEFKRLVWKEEGFEHGEKFLMKSPVGPFGLPRKNALKNLNNFFVAEMRLLKSRSKRFSKKASNRILSEKKSFLEEKGSFTHHNFQIFCHW